MNPHYPTALRSVLKVVPGFVLYMTFGTVWVLLQHNLIGHPKNRIEKYYFRDDRFTRVLRRRDDILRFYYQEAMNWQPTARTPVSERRYLMRH